MKDFFLAAGSLKLLLLEDALTYYNHLCEIGFTKSNYISIQLALVHYHLKGERFYLPEITTFTCNY